MNTLSTCQTLTSWWDIMCLLHLTLACEVDGFHKGNAWVFSGSVQKLLVALRDGWRPPCARSCLHVFSLLAPYCALWPACEIGKVPFCLMKPRLSLPFAFLPGNMKRSSQATSPSYRRSPRPCESGLPSGGSSMWWEDGTLVGFFFNGRIIALQYFVGLWHTSAWISHKWFITYVPSLLNNPLPSPTPSDSTRLSQNTELSFLHPTTHSHWLSILYVVMYMFPCCFLNSSPSPLPLPSPLLCPQFSFLRLCLHCCPVDRFISTIFLDSMRAVTSVSESMWPYGL